MSSPYNNSNNTDPQGNWYAQPPQQYQYPPQQPQRSNTGMIVAIILAVIAILAVLGMAGVLVFQNMNKGESTQSTVWETETVVPAPSGGSGGSGGQEVAPPQRSLPSGYTHAYAETGNTSTEFAGQTLSEFNVHYTNSGAVPSSMDVYSPVTGQTYTMSCWKITGGVRCQGGNNASVLLTP